MKKIIFSVLISVIILGFSYLQLFAASEKFELKTSKATLTIDHNGNLHIIQNQGQVIQVNTSIYNLWKVILKNNLNNREYTIIPDKNVTIDKSDKIFRLVVNSISIENKALPVKAEFTISEKDDAFCFSGSLKSDSDEWMLKELDYPIISGIQIKDNNPGIYWPVGLGQYFNDPVEFGNRSLRYPDGQGAAMAWFSLNSNDVGMYIGSHDSLQEIKVFNLGYDKSLKMFGTHINTPIFDHEYVIPEMILKIYNGQWHNAAKYYRSWYDKHFEIVKPPDWVRDDPGWLLAILKQQNMEVMWPYKDIDKLCDIAEQFNLSTISLFGWAVGGHDRYYPNYPPDNLMGGREELKKAIDRAHSRGIKIIIYANGKIMDTSTDFYKYNGFETILIQENGRPQIQYYLKQKNSTPVIFAQACTGSEVWRRTMYELGFQAASLGADGIIYDQVGIMNPMPCFSKNHDHKPGLGDAKNRLQMINEARQKSREVNPDFIVMTEGTNDAIIRGIDYHHGCGLGSMISFFGVDGFPELFRYTFPELIMTQRNPNPMITRTDANWALVYGLRHEIESRYPGDVEYLLYGTLPTAESYLNVVSPPSIKKMNLLPAAEATKYVHSLIEFEKNNSDFFRSGKFIDEDGIEVKGNDILAKGFVNGNKIGVVAWNQHLTEKSDFSVSVPGYHLIKAIEPENSVVEGTLPLHANSIRLLIFQKN